MANEDYASLARELRYLRDRRDVEDCIHRYCRGLDRLDREIALSAYHADAWDDRGAFVGSPKEFIDWVFPHLKTAKGTSHNIGNITCEIAGDVAHAESYINFHVWSLDGQSVIMGGARYVDRLERKDGRWGIAHREALMDYIVRVPAAPLQEGSLASTRDKTDRSYARPLELTADARRRLKEKRG